jgi:hypothetical protein
MMILHERLIFRGAGCGRQTAANSMVCITIEETGRKIPSKKGMTWKGGNYHGARHLPANLAMFPPPPPHYLTHILLGGG